MSEFVEVNAADLVGPALDWAAAVACGYECGRLSGKDGTFGCNAHDGLQYVIGPLRGATMIEELNARFFSPSTDWEQGGPLIGSYCQAVRELFGEWHATSTQNDAGRTVTQVGSTPLISTCRAIVAAKLGDTVQVPAELVGNVR